MKLFLAIAALPFLLSAPSLHAAQVEDGDAELQEVADRERVQPSRPGTRDCYRQLSICEAACRRQAQENDHQYRTCTMACPTCEE